MINSLNFSEIWGMGKYCRTRLLEYQQAGIKGRREAVPGNIDKITGDSNEPATKKLKADNDILERNVAFFRSHYPEVTSLPKSLLHSFAAKNRKTLPVYETQQVDRLFRTIVTFEKKKYASSYWEKNKKFAEQGAALVCTLHLGLIDEQMVVKNGGILA